MYFFFSVVMGKRRFDEGEMVYFAIFSKNHKLVSFIKNYITKINKCVL